MFESISKLFKSGPMAAYTPIDMDGIAELLGTSPEALAEFEAAYKAGPLNEIDSMSIFGMSAKQAAESTRGIEGATQEGLLELERHIVDELLAQTVAWDFDGKDGKFRESLAKWPEKPVTNADINAFPKDVRPQLAGNLMKRDIPDEAYPVLIDMYARYKNADNEKDRQMYYGMFRQGLDIQDLDPIMMEMLATNPNSMGHWLPQIAKAAATQGFFRIPKTTIIKVPMTLLQLTRCGYDELTRTTLDIVDAYCMEAFGLDTAKEYFVKTGTYSSKFDFRNCHVHGTQEVRELGEYLLFIHNQAIMMAEPLCQPCIYGVSTTDEWVVREFIPDNENNPSIYKGLPLHTEYRVFADFDAKKVIGVSPYWEPEMMKHRFAGEDDASNPHNQHDYAIFKMHEQTLMERYEKNVGKVVENIETLLQDTEGLSGQWSIDVMQNRDDFWLIDMALAQNSALKECVPEGMLVTAEENWLPDLSQKAGKE